MRVLLLVAISFLVSPNAFAQVGCIKYLVNKRVNDMYNSLPNTKEGKELISVVEGGIKDGTYKEGDRKQIYLANLELVTLSMRGCKVPDELRKRLRKFISLDKEGYTKECSDDEYLPQARQKYEDIKSSNGLDDYEFVVFKGIKSPMPQHSKIMFNEIWKNPDYRREITTRVLDAELRDTNKCIDVAGPMQELLGKIMEKHFKGKTVK